MTARSLALQRRVIPLVAAIVIAVGAPTVPAGAAAPSNDTFESATVIDALPFTVEADTTEATRSPDDPRCGLIHVGHTVWYAFTAPKDIRLLATVKDLAYVIAASGTPGSWTPRGCGEEEAGLRLSVAAGETVYLMLASRAGTPGGEGTLSVQRVRKPPNDDFDDARSITQLPFHATVDLDLATSADDDPVCFGRQHRTVWYTYTPGGEGLLDISVDYPDVTSVATNMTVSAYVGTRGSLDRVACGSADPISVTGPRIGIHDAVAGEPIYLMIGLDRASGPGFPVDVRVVPGHVPANDRLRDATEIVELPYRDDADSFWAGAVGDPPTAPGCDPSRHSIWYSFTTPSDMRLRVTTESVDNAFVGGGVTMVYAAPRASPSLLSCTVIRENAPGLVGRLEVNLRADQTVYVLADGFGGRLEFRARAVPVGEAPNDAIADATHVGQRSLPFSQATNARSATSGLHDPDCVDAHNTVWHAFTPAYTMLAEVSTAGSAYDTALAAFESIDDELSFIACRDDDLAPDPANGFGLPAERLRFRAEAGHSYRFMVGALDDPSLLQLSIREHVPVRIDPTGRVNDAGEAVITGTVRCSHRLQGFSEWSARQTLPSGAIRRGGANGVEGCSSVPNSFRVRIAAFPGSFRPGSIEVHLRWYFFSNSSDYAVTDRSARVRLE